MQKYFNTNTVSAEPMDELEAYEKGYVRSYSVSGYSKAPTSRLPRPVYRSRW